MTLTPTPDPGRPDALNWTCPFCSLLCDDLTIRADPASGALAIVAGSCAIAERGLASLAPPGTAPAARVDGREVALPEAIAEAARRLRSWRQPLFGGLGTDVAGARALYRLAAAAGAICDHAEGDALMRGVRAQQDRGIFYTTLGEVRARADLIVCAGTAVTPHYPEFFRRIGADDDGSACEQLVFLEAPLPEGLPARLRAEALQAGGLFGALQQLAALLGRQHLRGADAGLAALAERLRSARYAVFVWEAAALPAEGELIVETLHRCVGLLNRETRAAMFSLGGGDGAYSVNQVFTWLGGLPLRTRVSQRSLEHDPWRFGAARLVERGAVDGLLWISSFRPDRLPPAPPLPRIVLGPSAMAAEAGGDDTVFIAVATPGVNGPGHLFRTDGSIVVPLEPARDDGLPGVDRVLAQLAERLEAAA